MPSRRHTSIYSCGILSWGEDTKWNTGLKYLMAISKTLKDTIKMVSNYADIIIMRHFLEGAARYATEVTDVPVV